MNAPRVPKCVTPAFIEQARKIQLLIEDGKKDPRVIVAGQDLISVVDMFTRATISSMRSDDSLDSKVGVVNAGVAFIMVQAGVLALLLQGTAPNDVAAPLGAVPFE